MNEINWSDYTKVIGELPEHILKQSGILPDFLEKEPLGIILKGHKERQKIKAQWLERYLLDRVDLLPELTFTHKINYKPYAEQSLARLKLAQELYLKLNWIQEQMQSSAQWWFLCDYEVCYNALSATGVIGQPTQKGKRDWADIGSQYLALASDSEKLNFGIADRISQITPLTALECAAAAIAKEDIYFRNSYYREYLKVIKRCTRTIRNNPQLQGLFLVDGELRELGKHKKLSQTRKKGFVAKC